MKVQTIVRFRRTIMTASISLAVARILAGCAEDHRDATSHGVSLRGDREPFTFSSWTVDRVEWTAGSGGGAAEPPDVSAVMSDGTVLPLRGLTPGQVRPKSDPSTQPTPVVAGGADQSIVASGFHFDFTGNRLVHFLAVPYEKGKTTIQPVFENHGTDDRDVNGEVRTYAMPLDHDSCVHLFGGADGLETDLALPAVFP